MLAIALYGVLSGCSSRAFFQDNTLTPVFNLYNRNFIVATPTAFGNAVCGAPFFLLAAGLSTLLIDRVSADLYVHLNDIYFVPATMCGAVIGLPFIPFSYLCPENPWDYGFKTGRNLNLKCEKEESGFEVKWDIGPKDSVVEQDIVVTRDRVYRLELVFRSIYGQMSREDQREAFKFTGDGTYQYVTTESAKMDHPIVVPEYSQDEQDFLKSGGSLVGGEYFKAHPLPVNTRFHTTPPAGTVRRHTEMGMGVIVPIQIRLEQIGEGGRGSLQTEEVVNTEGFIYLGEQGIARQITTIHLRPGHYRLRAMTVKESVLPLNLETYLRAMKDLHAEVPKVK
jgi:hypothetical protein